MEKVPYETAYGEINGWLDSKKIPQKRREAQQNSIDVLINLVQEGLLSVNQDFTLTLRLNWPENVGMDQFTFKHRISEFELAPNRKLLKSNDPQSNLIATAATLISQPMALVQKLDSIDLENVNNIAVFF